jgi:hypothetical protein
VHGVVNSFESGQVQCAPPDEISLAAGNVHSFKALNILVGDFPVGIHDANHCTVHVWEGMGRKAGVTEHGFTCQLCEA